MEACDFAGRFPVRFELLNTLPSRHGVDEGGAASDPPWRHGEAVGVQGVMGFAGERASGRDGGEDGGSRGAGEGGDAARGGDGAQVEDRGSAGDSDRVFRLEGLMQGVLAGRSATAAVAQAPETVRQTAPTATE